MGCQEWWEPRELPVPTRIRPGPEKVAVFRARLEQGEALFHEDDFCACPEFGRLQGLGIWCREPPGLSIWCEEGECEP